MTILLLIFCAFKVYAQGYYPLHIGNLWEYGDCYDSSYSYTALAIGETTMTNGFTYTIVQHAAPLRQSGSRVYAYSRQAEFILYDFSKTTGDTVGINYYPSGETTLVIVVYNRTVNFFGKIRKQWGFYERWLNVNTSFYWLREVTDSVGLTFETYEPGIIVNCLQGAIIDGVQYGTITSVEPNDVRQAKAFELYQNFPNPFNNSTIITFTLPKEAYVTLRIFDIVGCEIKKLFDGKIHQGVQQAVWDGTNDFGYEVGTGTYIYQIQADNFTQTKKMFLIH
jgi:hypothetical protein